MEKPDLISQTKIAFEFIQKLYFEVSYLIKEVEGLLSQEDEKFVIGQSSGYAVTARSSSGLDPVLINFWMYKKLAVFFVPTDSTKMERGKTTTPLADNPKIIYMRIILDDKDIKEPSIFIGVLTNFKCKVEKRQYKIEQIMTSLEYNEGKVFGKHDGNIDYDDASVSFKGKLSKINLFDINTSEDIAKKLIAPVVKQFRET